MKTIINKIVIKISKLLRHFWVYKIGVIIRIFKKRTLPNNTEGKTLIHFGCGEFNDPRYINVDIKSGWHIHYVNSIENCEEIFPKNYADLIYACHVLEHVSHLKLADTLKGIYNSLKEGGVFRVSVPNFDIIVDIYREDKSISEITSPLMGGQSYDGNFHHSIFNKEYLTNLLISSGFKLVREWQPVNVAFHNFNDWSVKKLVINNKEWPISLNLEAEK